MPRSLPLAPLSLLIVAACGPLEPAPADLDGLLAYLWTGYDDREDEELQAALANVLAAIDLDAVRADPLRGTQSDLEPEDVAHVLDIDPEPARGFHLINPLDCELDALESVVVALEQDEQYPQAYDAYERTYLTDDAAYRAREAATLDWNVTSTSTFPLYGRYTSELSGGVRRLADDGDATPWGDALVSRTWMREPAVWEGDGNTIFDQDYQIEAWFEVAPGELLHVYGIWRRLQLAEGFDTDGDELVNLTLGGLEDWDDETEALCGD